jgi:hypothetical protein
MAVNIPSYGLYYFLFMNEDYWDTDVVLDVDAIVPVTSAVAYYHTSYSTQESLVPITVTITTGESSGTSNFGLLSMGASIVAISIAAVLALVVLRRREKPHALPPPPPRLGLCPRCGTMNPPTSKYCNECATKL